MNDRLQNHNFQFDMELFSREAAEMHASNRNRIPPGRHEVTIDKVVLDGNIMTTLMSGVLPKPAEPKAPTPVPQAVYGLGQRRIK